MTSYRTYCSAYSVSRGKGSWLGLLHAPAPSVEACEMCGLTEGFREVKLQADPATARALQLYVDFARSRWAARMGWDVGQLWLDGAVCSAAMQFARSLDGKEHCLLAKEEGGRLNATPGCLFRV